MTYLTGFLPVAQGVATHTALRRHAESLRGQGDQRSLGQLMADTLVARVTGREQADGVPVEIRLVTTAETLLGAADATEATTTIVAADAVDADAIGVAGHVTPSNQTGSSEEPGLIPGYGPIPAFLVRRLTREADKAWIRRLFTTPKTGELVAMESTRRFFDGLLRDLVITRDDTCRTPWCDAPIRHIDHVIPAAEGGPTSAENAQGLCERCNHTKQAPGWHARPGPEPDSTQTHTTQTLTPTGHRHTSQPPPLPGAPPDRPARAPVELTLYYPDFTVEIAADYSAA